VTACPQGGGSYAGTTTVWTASRPAGLRFHPGPRRRHASGSPQEWHRYNIYEPLGPSHERLQCLTDTQWRCKYDTVPEPDLGFSNPNVIGTFVGTDVTGTWECPKGHGFPADICDSATSVISGVQTFIQPGGERDSLDAVFIVTDDGALWDYFVGFAVCPWYPTFEQALTSPAECKFIRG
jgi:hypothetical protein